MPLDLPIGSTLYSLLEGGRQVAQGLPATVSTGWNYLKNRTPQAFMESMPWNQAADLAGALGVHVQDTRSGIPDFSIGGGRLLPGSKGLPPPPRPAQETKRVAAPRPTPPSAPMSPQVPADATYYGWGGPLTEAQQKILLSKATSAGMADLDVPLAQNPEIASSPTQTAPQQPSPSPSDGGTLRGIANFLAQNQGQIQNIARDLGRPGSDRPYAQMGFDDQTMEQWKQGMAQQELGLQRGGLDMRQQEIEARTRLAQQEAMDRLTLMREEMAKRGELQSAELEARYGGGISPEVAKQLGLPPGTSLRETEIWANAQAQRANAARDQAYNQYLTNQSTQFTQDNQRQGIVARINAIAGTPYAWTPQGQHELNELQKLLTPGVQIAPFVPPPAAQPPPEQPGLFDRIGGFFGGLFGGGGEAPMSPGQPTQGAGVPGQDPGMGQPQAQLPPPVPPSVMTAIAPLPAEARNIIINTYTKYAGDPAGLRAKLQEIIAKAPPEHREVVMKALAPVLARQ